MADLWADIAKQRVQGADIIVGAFIGAFTGAGSAFVASFFADRRRFKREDEAVRREVYAEFTLRWTLAHSGRPDALAVSGASLAALSAVSLLALYAHTIAGSLSWLWPLQEIGMGAYALGLLSVGTSAFRARLFGCLRALPLVVASLWLASIGLLLLWDRSGMVLPTELNIGALPYFGAALLGWVMLNHHPTERTRPR